MNVCRLRCLSVLCLFGPWEETANWVWERATMLDAFCQYLRFGCRKVVVSPPWIRCIPLPASQQEACLAGGPLQESQTYRPLIFWFSLTYVGAPPSLLGVPVISVCCGLMGTIRLVRCRNACVRSLTAPGPGEWQAKLLFARGREKELLCSFPLNNVTI